MDVPVSAREKGPLYRLWALSQEIRSKKSRQGNTPSQAAEAELEVLEANAAIEAIKAAHAYLSSARGRHAELLCSAGSEKLAASLIGIWDWALRILRRTEGTAAEEEIQVRLVTTCLATSFETYNVLFDITAEALAQILLDDQAGIQGGGTGAAAAAAAATVAGRDGIASAAAAMQLQLLDGGKLRGLMHDLSDALVRYESLPQVQLMQGRDGRREAYELNTVLVLQVGRAGHADYYYYPSHRLHACPSTSFSSSHLPAPPPQTALPVDTAQATRLAARSHLAWVKDDRFDSRVRQAAAEDINRFSDNWSKQILRVSVGASLGVASRFGMLHQSIPPPLLPRSRVQLCSLYTVLHSVSPLHVPPNRAGLPDVPRVVVAPDGPAVA